MNKKILNKHGAVTTDLARSVMALNKGDRLPTIIELTERFSVSRGIVQNAISFLEEAGCFTLSRSGKLGTLLDTLDYRQLYEFTGWDPIVGAMPVPFNDSFRSLASALFSESRRFPVDSSVIYVSGASNRQTMLEKDFLDYIVTSVAAARHIIAASDQIELLFELPDCRYEEPYCLIFLDNEKTAIEDGMRVGVDPEGIDQTELTKALCRGKNVELVPMPFENTVEMLHSRSVDCSVIRREKWLRENLNLIPRPIPPTDYPEQDTTVPAILVNRNNYGIKEFLQKYLSPENIAKAQTAACAIHSQYTF